MRLKLHNIGMLKHAELRLHPLCVVAGENDNGKSTVGKIVFCIIKAINHHKEGKERSIVNAFSKVFASEFDDSLLLQGTSEGSIELWENDLLLLRLGIGKQNDDNLEIQLQDEPEPLELKDATFIETPLILNYHDLLSRSQTMLEVGRRTAGRTGLSYTTLHTKDLFDKLLVPALPTDLLSADRHKQAGKLQSIIDGSINYSRKQRDFVFQRDNESISIKNTASGIKVFGLLQILLNNEIIGKNTMLIFDEPENHLHPKWQLKLAEFLVYLASQGVYVLVSSHSPYMIEALKRYADRDGLKDQQGFFLAKNRRIEDKDQLSEIFQVLAEPFEIFRQMDAEALRDE